MALHWHDRLARSSGTKLIGKQQLTAWFQHLSERGCFISTKNQRCLRKIQKPDAALIKANIRQFLSILSKSISCPFKDNVRMFYIAVLCSPSPPRPSAPKKAQCPLSGTEVDEPRPFNVHCLDAHSISRANLWRFPSKKAAIIKASHSLVTSTEKQSATLFCSRRN